MTVFSYSFFLTFFIYFLYALIQLLYSVPLLYFFVYLLFKFNTLSVPHFYEVTINAKNTGCISFLFLNLIYFIINYMFNQYVSKRCNFHLKLIWLVATRYIIINLTVDSFLGAVKRPLSSFDVVTPCPLLYRSIILNYYSHTKLI